VAVRILFLLLALSPLLASCGATTGARPRPPDPQGVTPAAAFFRAPALSHLTLSPDGRHIAGITTLDGVQLLVARPTRGGEIRYLAKLDEPGQGIAMVGWPGDDRILVSVEMRSQTARGVRARQTRLLSVPLDGSNPGYLGENWPHQEYSQYQDQIIDWLQDDPEHVLINWWEPGENGTGVRRVHVASGNRTPVVSSIPFMRTWATDHRGHVRAGWGSPRNGTGYFLYARIGPDDDFEKVVDFDPFEEPGFYFAGFSEDPAKIYVISSAETGRDAVYTFDLATKQRGALVFDHPLVDVGPLHFSAQDGRLLSIEYTTDRPRLHFVDAKAKLEQSALDRQFPGTTNRIVSRDRDDTVAIVSVSGATTPPSYYLYDRRRKTLELLIEAYPELRSAQLSPMKPISFRARDDLEIPGYLTLPRSAPPGPGPAIVYVHGGPTARDVWGYDPTVQFLASRGFAVLQPNYRGSSGYGARHQELGYRQWGLTMQDDLTDAARWLIAQGIADPRRIGIYGGSYGGYAALMALVREPELFTAGASFAGVTDLVTMVNDDKWYLFDDWNRPTVGSSWSDRSQLRETSPAQLADKIRSPVLIAHGTDDPTVHVKHAEMMADALEDLGKPVETHLYDREVHGFLDERNQIDFYARLGDFFARHLPASSPVASGAVGDPAGARNPD
jgi:acetyl esterase/lipase